MKLSELIKGKPKPITEIDTMVVAPICKRAGCGKPIPDSRRFTKRGTLRPKVEYHSEACQRADKSLRYYYRVAKKRRRKKARGK